MASKKTTAGGDRTIPAANYQRMLDVMHELTFRSKEHEATVMRIAKAGGITEATAEITRLRKYAKAHLAAATETNSAGGPASGARRKSKSKSRRNKNAGGDPSTDGGKSAE